MVLTQRKDISDAQYSTFRENIPYMGLLVVFHPFLRRLHNALQPVRTNSKGHKGQINGNTSPYASSTDAQARLEQRASFDFWFALVFLVALHGFSALKVLLILYLNFSIATRLPKKFVPIATWVFNIGTLFANEIGAGYPFASIVGFTSAAPEIIDGKIQNWGTWFDSYGGLMPRWEILFNITVLRLISFNMDYYWSLDRRESSPTEVINELNLSTDHLLILKRRNN